jgi:aryl-alcohol dehydrogenase-like predicted oxidoreductase
MLILGTAQLRGNYGAVGRADTTTSDADARALVERSAQVGFGALDTAPAYDDAEDLIGSANVALPIHTKIDPALDPRTSLQRSLRRLRREAVQVLSFHAPTIALHDPTGAVDAAHALVGEQVDTLGASVYEPVEFSAAVEDRRFGAVQAPISVLDRRLPTEELAWAREHGTQVFARSVFLQGLLLADPVAIPPRLSPIVPYVEAMQHVAAECGIAPMTLALGWVRDLPGVSGIVVGAQRISELDALVGAWSSPPLPADVRAAVDNLPMPPLEWQDPRRWPH